MVVFNINASVSYLSNLIEIILDGAFDQAAYEASGIAATFKRSGKAEFNIQQNEIELAIPLQIHLKRDAALFSAEGHGELKLNLTIWYDISKDLKISAKSSITSHEWIEKPIIDFGSVDLPVTAIADLMIDHYDSIITAQINEQLNSSINLKQRISDALLQVNQRLNENNYYGIRTNISLKDIMLVKPQMANGNVGLNGALGMDINIEDGSMDIADEDINFRWAERIAPQSIEIADVEIGYRTLEKIILAFVNEQEYAGDKIYANHCKITKENNSNKIELTIEKPLSGNANLLCSPRYNEDEGKLYMDNIRLKITPDSFLYKLTAPLLNKYILTMITGMMPIDIRTILAEKWLELTGTKKEVNHVEIVVSGKPIELNELKFTEDGIFGKLKATDLLIKANLKDLSETA